MWPPAIPELKRLKQEDLAFEAKRSHPVRPSLNSSDEKLESVARMKPSTIFIHRHRSIYRKEKALAKAAGSEALTG